MSRELYKDINPAFIADWKAKTGETIAVNQSHGGSSKQAMSVAAGLDADVITMNQAPDIDILVERGGLVAADWRKRFPHDATPYTTTTVFLVRKGNPEGHQGLGRSGQARRAGDRSQSQDLGQRALHLPGGLGLRPAEIRHAKPPRATS